ncbi:hypothetical protein P3G55_12945 [Leptospira sp. 96542]|nr:hypothetical protein [Leptospira sp. 96542]
MYDPKVESDKWCNIMYSNDDLNKAVENGIFNQKDVWRFRNFINKSQNSPSVDEEELKLITSFNDVFVVSACSLFIICTNWVVFSFLNYYSLLLTPLFSWFLAEFFVKKRKMALPGIVLLAFFTGGLFLSILSILIGKKDNYDFHNISFSVVVAFIISTIGTYFHWRRFKVPITLAILVLALVGTFISILFSIWPNLSEQIFMILIGCGFLTFVIAIYWDKSDLTRVSYRSDTAFWLHILSAPLIIHPLFKLLGVFDKTENSLITPLILFIFLVFVFISLVIDRRAFMVSSLIYVIYALSIYFESFGEGDLGIAMSGIIIGFSLIILSAFWNSTRVKIINHLPSSVKKMIPDYDNS